MTAPAAHDVEVLRRVGQTLRKKWHLDAVLGVGAMGAVYAATHKNGRRAAIKILHAALAVDPALRRRLLREGYSANAVAHSGAVDVLDEDVAEDGCPYLVMELLEGRTFAEIVTERGPLPAREALELVEPLLRTLESAHARGILHRDLKPSNMFLTDDGRIKVCDFGLAEISSSTIDISTLHTSSFIGTPAFVAPEQARGLTEEVDTRSDLWSVGATLFFLLTAEYVHEGRTATELLAHTITRAPRSIRTVRSDLPAPVSALVDRALAFEKADRFASAESMRAAIERALAGKSSIRPARWMMAPLVLALLVIGVAALVRTPAPPNRLESGVFANTAARTAKPEVTIAPVVSATPPPRIATPRPSARTAASAKNSPDPFAARF